jgi:hypothetical protein
VSAFRAFVATSAFDSGDLTDSGQHWNLKTSMDKPNGQGPSTFFYASIKESPFVCFLKTQRIETLRRPLLRSISVVHDSGTS